MATRLYFHNASANISGTLPSGEQSTRTPSWTATGGATNRTMDTEVGAAQATHQGNTLANTSVQNALLGMFVSPTLDSAQTVGGGSMTLNVADDESNGNANFWINALNVYVWRPSTGAKIGTVRDAAALGGTETAGGERVTHITGITSAGVSALAGDVIVCEVWAQHTQSAANTYIGAFFYDGTTENTTENASVTNHASFIELTETLTFVQAGGRIRMMI